MALKVLLLKKRLDNKRKALETLRGKLPGFANREQELTRAIDEVETDEQRAEVEGLITAFETERDENARAIAALEGEIEGLENELAAEEAAQDTGTPTTPAEAQRSAQTNYDQRRQSTMSTRTNIPRMTLRDRVANMATRDDVKGFATAMRGLIGQKRAITGGEVIIPEVMLPLIRELVADNSLLLKHVNLQPVHGTARQTIMGTVPEAVWTEMCGKLNELDLAFNDAEVDGYKVGAYIAICNALKEDNDVELVTQILFALGRAEALAVDKAIVYGTGTKMPQGIVTRLLQTEAPSGARPTERAWADLHTSNVITISAENSTGIKLFQHLLTAFGNAKKRYGAGGKVWAMNEKTHAALVAEAMNINAAGAIVSGMSDTMPVIGGAIEELDFIPDNVIVAGYGQNYLMAERATRQVEQSEHVRFIEDLTVFKSTARYDGKPVIPESFVAIGINGASVTNAVSFAPDTANVPVAVWLPATASVAVGGTVTLTPVLTPYDVKTTFTWTSGTAAKATVSGGVVTGVATGSSVITVTTANGLTAQCTVTVTAE